MKHLEAESTRELFLILEPFCSRLDELLGALEPLGKPNPSLLASSSIYYRPDTDVALLSLRVPDAEREGGGEAWLRDFAKAAGLPLLEPARLADGDRRRFYDTYLEGYPIRTGGALGARSSALALARRLGLEPSEAGEAPAAAESSGELVWPAQPLAARTAQGPTEPPREGRRAPVGSGARERPAASPRGKGRASDRLRTIPGWRDAGGSVSGALPEPAGPAAERPAEGAAILARYLRGDEWVPARLRALSLRGAHLATEALPRSGDTLPIALAFGDAGAVVRGRVVETTARGESPRGFRVAFSSEESAAFQKLTALLRKARDAGLSLEPPPPRTAARYPLRWPTRVAFRGGKAVVSALDISEGGLFFATQTALEGDNMAFHLPLERDKQPVVGRARVVRSVSAAMAQGRGLAPGYGVEIVDLADSDRQRYQGFVSRVSHRVDRRVVVAAEPDRAGELTELLSAVGYAVTSCADADWLELLPNVAPQPPDAVVIDSALRTPAIADLKRRLGEQKTPYIAAGPDITKRLRARVDRALGIA